MYVFVYGCFDFSSDCSFSFCFFVMFVDLKKLRSEGAVVVHKHVYRYMFDDLDGLDKIEVDLLRFWWLWRKSKFAGCGRLLELQ